MGYMFEELAVGSMRAKNRFVRAATYDGLATDDGHLTPELLAVYEGLAQGGAGTIITGYAYVMADEHPNPNMMGIYDDSFVTEYRELVRIAHEQDTRIVLQIVYGGSGSKLDPPSERILGPSAVAHPKTGIVPVEASDRDIRALAKAFAAAAGRAKSAGFDGVELHAAHGYLLSQFLSPLFNRRTDAYGGTVENRARIVLEIVQAVRASVGPDYPIMAKINSSDGIEGGLTEGDSLRAATMLVQHGVDALEVSGAWRACSVKAFGGEPFFAGYAKRLAEIVDVPIILTGGNRRLEAMERLGAEAGIAAFGLCRPLICEPDLVNRWNAEPQTIPRCISCGGCDATHGHRCILPSV